MLLHIYPLFLNTVHCHSTFIHFQSYISSLLSRENNMSDFISDLISIIVFWQKLVSMNWFLSDLPLKHVPWTVFRVWEIFSSTIEFNMNQSRYESNKDYLSKLKYPNCLTFGLALNISGQSNLRQFSNIETALIHSKLSQNVKRYSFNELKYAWIYFDTVWKCHSPKYTWTCAKQF